MRHLLPLVVLVLAGCHRSHEGDVVGDWTSQKGMKVNVAADKTYTHQSGPLTVSGTWAVEGDDLTLTPKTMNGKPIAELKSNLERNMGRISPARQPLAQKMLADMDKPNVMTIGADGKTLTTDKAKDKNLDPWTPLTKSP